MRASAALVCLLAAAAVAHGAAVEHQPRLVDRALLLPGGGGRIGDSAGGPLLQPSPWQQQQQQHLEPLEARWWQRLWPWGRDPERLVRVAPVRPDGSLAAAAELRLPASQVAAEGLRPVAGNPAISPEVGAGDNGYYSYNSSEMTPLVPLWLAWMTDVTEMSNRSHGLEFETAWRLSSYVAISYCNTSSIAAWNCTRCNGISAGFEPEEVVFDAAWDLLGYVGYSAPLDGIVVAFRGTDSHSIYNWVQNMRTWRTDLALGYPGAPQHALVHGGFFTSYNGSSLAANVSAAVARLRQRHPDSPIYVSGHSMGGALATLCALDMRLNLGAPDVRLYTFGSPRVGNQIFAEWFEKQIKVHWRFTHNRDIVPSVPPGYMGFYHISREVWLVDLLYGHTLVGVCDSTGEDMACHNSMCHLGLCSSVSDHLLYLSEMYSPHPQGC